MADVLTELRARIEAGRRTDEPAYVGLVRLITLGGRLPYQAGVDALTARDLAVLRQVLGDESLRLDPLDDANQLSDADSSDGSDHIDGADPPSPGKLLVRQSPQGRISFMDSAAAGEAEGSTVAQLTVTPPMMERVAEDVLAWEIAERAEQADLDRILRHWADLGVLADRVREVADWVDRVETVLLYIGDQTYSRSDAGTSTLLRDGRLSRLAQSALDDWPVADRLFVAAAHLLFTAGRSIRFEEFNGRQFSATALRSWLVATWRRYAHATGTPAPAQLAGRPLETLAKEVGELSEAVNRSDWIRFRRVAGPTFAKTEALAELPPIRRSHAALPTPIRRFAEHVTGDPPDPELPAEAAVAVVVDALLAGPAEDVDRGLGGLLATIVRSAVVDLDADYAMSSAVRDIRRLAPVEGRRVAGILDLRKPDFFCCVIPHPQRLADWAEADLGRVLWLVAQRMQYNRWHFAPGNFERAEVPRQRHYFFPPVLPDLAEFSDLWHGGHITAEVRYSVRAPGVQLWREALDVGGNAHRGCFDIRAVRMHGTPFRRKQLWTAVRYSGLVDALWRRVAARVNDGWPVPPITGFDRDWYERAQWTSDVDQLR
jgi:hypothetical protein